MTDSIDGWLEPMTAATAAATEPMAAPRRPDDTGGDPTAPPAPGGPEPTPADAPWSRLFGSPSLAPDVYSVAVQDGSVYVGGGFIYAMAGTASFTYNRIAEWDGTGWRRMGEGADAPVHAIAVVGRDVYIGGDFTMVGGDVAATHLARWDGERWWPVAGGVDDPEGRFGTTVTALATDGATLWVGGQFTRAGELPARSLAALDLATGTWSDAGGGVATRWSSDPVSVRALTLDGTSLHVGGVFDLAGGTEAISFATLETTTGDWTSYGPGITDGDLSGSVKSIAVDPMTGSVYLGGRFATAGDTPSLNLAVWRDGRFLSLGDFTYFGGPQADVRTLAVVAGSLYAGGIFTVAGNAETSHWARHDGQRWSAVAPLDNSVTALAPFGESSVVVLGEFTFSQDLRVVHGGIWTGTGWETFGRGVTSDPNGGGAVNAITPAAGGAYVGGLFDQAGELPVAGIARWTGSSWDAMGGGVGARESHGQVCALQELGAHLYVGGRFDTAGGLAAPNIARWDGTRWSTLGSGVDGTVYAMAVLGGRLYVGGRFNTAGGVAASCLACWDPATETWSVIGHNPTYDDDIRALAVLGDRWLVVGGDFHRFFFGGLPVATGLWGMALFDTGLALGDDPLSGYRHLAGTSRYGGTGMVNALHVLDGDLYVGGWFDVAGLLTLGPAPTPGFAAANLAVWHAEGDGTWEGIGGADHTVQAFATVDGTLAVGGWFAAAGGVPALRVSRYDPVTRNWSALGSGLSDGATGGSFALALAQSSETGLWVGGQFPCAGNSPSANLALWTATRDGG